MSSMTANSDRPHRRIEREIERLICGDLSPTRHEKLRDHLRGCGSCEAYYERARRAEEALLRSEGLSNEAIERLAALIVPGEESSQSRRSPLGAWLFAAAGSAAIAALVLAIVPFQDDTLTARGVTPEPARAAIRVFRVIPEQKRVERLKDDDRELRVAVGDILQLAYRNESYHYAVVIGVDETYAIQWYHPEARPPVSGGVALQAEVDGVPFGQAWQLDPEAEQVRLFALFGDIPIDVAAIEEAVAALAAAHTPLGDATRLDVAAAEQDTVLLSVHR